MCIGYLFAKTEYKDTIFILELHTVAQLNMADITDIYVEYAT